MKDISLGSTVSMVEGLEEGSRMLKEVLAFGVGYLIGRSKARLGTLFILACAAYTLFAIYVGVMFFLGLMLTPVRLILRLARAITLRFSYPR